jgi:hypothetical protein
MFDITYSLLFTYLSRSPGKSSQKTMMPSPPLQHVADILVTAENPIRTEIDGMDSTRCAALRNAIFEHGLISSGRDVEAFHQQARPLTAHMTDASRERFHPSLWALLEQALVLLDGQPQQNFFYYLYGLNYPSAETIWMNWNEDAEPNRILTLYGTFSELTDHPDGLV